MDELKPCPFCGEKMLVGECQGGYYFKLCERCKREARVRTYHDLAGCVPARSDLAVPWVYPLILPE